MPRAKPLLDPSASVLVLKVTSLLSACGGPLAVHDWWLKDRLPKSWAFAVLFAPVLLLVLGWQYLGDRDGEPERTFFVQGGVVGAVLLLASQPWGLWLWRSHSAESYLWLLAVGGVMGTWNALAYLRRVFGPPLEDEVPTPRDVGPTRSDWGYFAISLTFVLLGLFLLPRKPKLAAVELLLFGSTLWHSIHVLRRKRREAADEAAGRVFSGVVFGHSYERRRKPLVLVGLGLSLGGGAVVWLSTDFPLLFRLLCALVALGGVVLLLGVALRGWPHGYLRLERSGLFLGERDFEYRVPWDAVASAGVGEYLSHPAVWIHVPDLERVDVVPPEERGRALDRLRRNAERVGAEILVLPRSYGLDARSLEAAIGGGISVSSRASSPAPARS